MKDDTYSMRIPCPNFVLWLGRMSLQDSYYKKLEARIKDEKSKYSYAGPIDTFLMIFGLTCIVLFGYFGGEELHPFAGQYSVTIDTMNEGGWAYNTTDHMYCSSYKRTHNRITCYDRQGMFINESEFPEGKTNIKIKRVGKYRFH